MEDHFLKWYMKFPSDDQSVPFGSVFRVSLVALASASLEA